MTPFFSWFEYGAGNNRTRRRQGNFNTRYLNGGADVQIERLTHNNNSDVTTKYHYLANGKVVAIDEESSSGTEERYLHSDRLGSASVLTDSFGAVVEKMSYDIWGQVRNLSSGANSSVLKSDYHTKSFTGHEALADVDLVHMNGRIYDPILGRFMSADPFVQYVFNSQSYNRYSYVLNNPLGATDPSGYFTKSNEDTKFGEPSEPESMDYEFETTHLKAPDWNTNDIGLESGEGGSTLSFGLTGDDHDRGDREGGADYNVGVPLEDPMGEVGGQVSIPRIPVWARNPIGFFVFSMTFSSNFSDGTCSSNACTESIYESKVTWPPYNGPPGGYEEGPRRGREYGEDGKPIRDFDNPHQGADYPHIHEWDHTKPNPREHPGRPYSPIPKKDNDDDE